MSVVRVAGIDCGTNSIRLLIADVDPAGSAVHDLVRRMEVVRLGQGVDRTGVIAPDALARTLAMTGQYAAACREAGVEVIRFVATSATRDARNRQEFVDGVRDALGVEPEVVPGREEAELSFLGAIGALAGFRPGPYLTVDLGGGSTELVLGGGATGSAPEGGATVAAAVSMDVGCVRMTERRLPGDPPTADQIAVATADVEAALDAAEAVVPLGRTRTLVGLAGSVTTITAYALGLDRYDPARIDRAVLSPARTLEACDRLLAMPRCERAALGFMHPGRVDVIGGGALVWSRVVRRVLRATADAGAELGEVLTSEHDILDGIAISAARRAAGAA